MDTAGQRQAHNNAPSPRGIMDDLQTTQTNDLECHHGDRRWSGSPPLRPLASSPRQVRGQRSLGSSLWSPCILPILLLVTTQLVSLVSRGDERITIKKRHLASRPKQRYLVCFIVQDICGGRYFFFLRLPRSRFGGVR